MSRRRSGECKLAIVVAIAALAAVGRLSAERPPPLIQAIRVGDATAVKAELSKRVNPNLAPTGEWDLPLIEACIQTNLGIVKLLTEDGASVSNRSTRLEYGSSPLMVSLNMRRADIAAYLISRGADPEGTTPLMLAVIARDVPEVERVIRSGANVDAINNFGRSALDYAHPDGRMVSLLLKAGARHRFSEVEIAAMLNDTNRVAAEIPRILRAGDEHLAKRALHRAIEYGNAEVVRVLLSAGVDTGLDGAERMTALCVAAWHGKPEIIRLLLSAGADPNVRCDGLFLPADIALVHGHTNCAAILRSHLKN